LAPFLKTAANALFDFHLLPFLIKVSLGSQSLLLLEYCTVGQQKIRKHVCKKDSKTPQRYTEYTTSLFGEEKKPAIEPWAGVLHAMFSSLILDLGGV
jgi:hypothetical protein